MTRHLPHALPVALLVLAACGSSSQQSQGFGTSSPPANPCASRGASYLESFSEVSGDCGPLPSQVVNINSDGTLTTSSPISCAHVEQDGCTARDTDCTSTANGCTVSSTFDVTFAQDGSSASGTITLSASGDGCQSCTSTYDVTFARQ